MSHKTYFNVLKTPPVTDKLYHIELNQEHLATGGNQTHIFGGDMHLFTTQLIMSHLPCCHQSIDTSVKFYYII